MRDYEINDETNMRLYPGYKGVRVGKNIKIDVKEQIAKIMRENACFLESLEWDDLDEEDREMFRKEADQILAIEGLEVRIKGDDKMEYREHLIQQIEGLYPTDAQYEQTAEIGKRLLEQAKMEVEGWRNESIAVLQKYAELCNEEERRAARLS